MGKRYRLHPAYKWFLGILVVCGVLAIAAALYVHRMAHDGPSGPIINDLSMLRNLTRALTAANPVPLDADGRVDPFALCAEYGEDLRDCFSSERRDFEPAAAEVAAGDYSNFPWARALGPIDPKGPARPLFWEPEPMPDGLRLVAFTDGAVKVIKEAEFQKLAVR